MTDIMKAMLEAEKALENDITGDILASGGQIRLTPGTRTVTPVDEFHVFFDCPDKLALTRFSVREQGEGMKVVTANITVKGERIGLVHEGKDMLHPIYVPKAGNDPFFTWRTWFHQIPVEYMNVNDDTVNEIIEALTGLDSYGNFDPSKRRRSMVPEGEEIERKSVILHDLEPTGDTMEDRYGNALGLGHLTILTDKRIGPLLTEYPDPENVGKMKQRAGFTSWIDALSGHVAEIAALQALPADVPDRARILSDAGNRTAILTGVDRSAQRRYQIRPTVGYLSVAHEGEAGDSFLTGKEMVFFPPKKDDLSTGKPAEEAAYEGTDPFAAFGNPE